MSCFCKLRFLAIMLVWPIALPLLAAELPSEPRPRDRQITVLVTTLLESQHLSKHPLDDEIAKRTLAQFLKRLDPRKLYFNQSDVDQFLKLESQLNDRLSDHDLTIAYTIFHRFRERVGERAETIEKLLTGKFDFTLKETINQDTSLNQFAENQQQAENRWRHQIKYDLLTLYPRDPFFHATREQFRAGHYSKNDDGEEGRYETGLVRYRRRRAACRPPRHADRYRPDGQAQGRLHAAR